MLSQKVMLACFLVSNAFLVSTGLLFSQNHNIALSAYSNLAISNEQIESWHPQGIEVKKK